MAGGIRNLKRQNHHERRVVRPCQEVAEIATDMVAFVDEAQPKGTCDVGTQEKKDEFAPVVIGKAIVEKDAYLGSGVSNCATQRRHFNEEEKEEEDIHVRIERMMKHP